MWSVLLGLVNGGWSEEDIWAELLNPTNVGGRYLQDRHRQNQTAARTAFRKDYAKAVTYVAANPAHDPQDASLALVLIQLAVEDRPDLFSPARAGVSERMLMRALVRRGLERSSRLVRVSLRQLAEDVDMRPDTVSKALARLMNAGHFLEQYEGAARGRATAYSLKCPSTRTTVTRGLDPRVPTEPAVTVVGGLVHRLFGANGLPLGALETYARVPAREPLREVPAGGGSPVRGEHHGVGPDVEVSARSTLRRPKPRRRGAAITGGQERPLPAATTGPPLTAAELARLAGRPVSTVRRHLLLMERWGLVHKDSFGGWQRVSIQPDVLAEKLGVVDDVPRKAARHRRERQGYLDSLVQRGCLLRQSEDGLIVYVDRQTGEVVGRFDQRDVHRNVADRSAV